MALMMKSTNINWKRICDALHDLEPFVECKIREKHPWRSVTFSKSKSATLLNVALHHRCFSRFLNCTSGIKSCKASHIFHAICKIQITSEPETIFKLFFHQRFAKRMLYTKKS